MESSDVPVKSSNEILTELFGAFNAEPPKIDTTPNKRRSSSDERETRPSKKAKRSKNKKSKKKHKSKSKSKKHKKKRSSDDSGSESHSDKVSKKKSKNKSKKHRKHGKSSGKLNIELPVNEVPMALEIMLDGTVGIKGEDGLITKIPDSSENHWDGIDEEDNKVNGEVPQSQSSNIKKIKDNRLQESARNSETNLASDLLIPEVFESDIIEQGEKQKKGKIQIRDLKFSSVFQEAVKAVEEKQKKELEKKANYEEGELTDSNSSEKNSDNENVEGDRSASKAHKSTKHKHRSHSKGHRLKDDDLRIYLKRRKRSRSRSTSRHGSRSRHRSSERSSHKKMRSRSRDYHHGSYYPRRHSPSLSRSHQSSGRTRDGHRSRSRSRRSRSDDRKIETRSRHRSKSREIIHRSKTKSKERSDSSEKIDKEKLLAIARKNALKLIDAGVVPGAEKMTTIKAGGKTVNELTEYCKKLSKKEALGDDVSDIESESSDEEEKPFHHPFQVRDRPNSIVMNIKNSIPLPVKSMQEKAAEQSKQLRLQFPVSSGSSHRRTESEWIPVSPKKDEVPEKVIAPIKISVPAPQPVEKPLPPPPLPPMPPMPQHIELSAVPPPPEPYNKPVFPVIQPNAPLSKLDISSIVSKRLEAMRKLQENPNDSTALSQMYNAQQEMQYWAESKQETGAFTGSTGAKVLSASELSSGVQAWAKRDQLTSATPVKGGMGMALLQKMGWQPGEGLGKNKEGTLEPLKLEVKMDKKGLLAADESRKGGRKGPTVQPGPPLPTVKTLDGKHPVSLLNEFCSRRRYGVPQFELCFECGPDHKKNFLFKVKVNGIEYTPSVASPNKKQAKAEAAAICLRALGVISSTA